MQTYQLLLAWLNISHLLRGLPQSAVPSNSLKKCIANCFQLSISLVRRSSFRFVLQGNPSDNAYKVLFVQELGTFALVTF